MQYPLSQRRHTNVATVRYQKNGVRLEIACYKNKVISYRSGTESRLDEVLQVDRVFSNVARGHVASKEDIAAVFGRDTTEEEAIKIMLEHGELQVAQQERAAETDEIAKSIALLIAQRCVNTKTQRPFPAVVIEQALKSIGAGVKLDQPAKKQALGLIHQLVESQIIPIARANMKLRCLTPTEDGVAALDKWCLENGAQVVERKTTVAGDAPDGPEKPEARTSLHSLLVLVQPHLFRDLDTLVKAKLPAGSSMHMVDAAAMEMGESNASVIMGSAAALSSTGVGGGGSIDLDSNCGSQPQCGLPGGGSSFVASADRDADGGGGKRKGKKDLRKQSRRGGRGKTVSSDEDDRRGADRGSQSDADEEENTNKKGQRRQRGQRSEAAQAAPDAANLAEADALAAELMKLGLDPTKDFNENDEEEGHGPKGRKGKGKNKGKGGRGGNPPQQEQPEPTAGGKQSKQQQQTTAPVKEVENGSDSDEELSGNRRQRKKNTQRQQQQQQRNAQPYSNGSLNPSDEDYNYGEDEEEEAVPS